MATILAGTTPKYRNMDLVNKREEKRKLKETLIVMMRGACHR